MFTKYLHFLIIFICLFIVIITFVAQVKAQQSATSNQVCTKVGTTDEKSPCQGPGKLVYYCQGGPPWGNTCGMGKAGCGPTSIAMIMSTFGVTKTPDQVNDVMLNVTHTKEGCFGNSDGVITINSAWFKDLGFSHAEDVAPGGNFDLDKARNYLSQGYYILGSSTAFPLTNCSNSDSAKCLVGHIFVVDSVDQADKIRVRDPNNCDYMPGSGAERAIRSYGKNDFSWYYAYPIKCTDATKCHN